VAADRQLLVLGPGVIRAGMLRGSYSPVGIVRADKPFLLRLPPAGKYVFRYAVTSGKGDWAVGRSYRVGMGFSNPLAAVSAVDELSSKQLPPVHSFCSLAAENLVVSAVKKAERDGAIVVRVFEAEGARAETAVEFLGRRRSFQAVNLPEETAGQGERNLLRVRPYEISTLRIRIE
jgi:alpha-mannosidase